MYGPGRLRVVNPGGSGQVGAILARSLQGEGHEVVVLSRRPGPAPWRVVVWDGQTSGAWADEIDGADVEINLAGRSVNCRSTAANRREIRDSRIDSTRAVGAAIAQAGRPPRVWLQAGTATIYAHRHDAPNDEATGVIGGSERGVPASWRFSVDVASAWERALAEAETPGTRRVVLRSAMTMSPDRGGVFATLLGLVRRGLGACRRRPPGRFLGPRGRFPAGGRLADRPRRDCRPGQHRCARPLAQCGVHAATPSGGGVAIGLPATGWMLGLGAIMLQTETELILKSRWVVPGRLLESGFTFRFPTWEEAADDLCRRWRGAALGPEVS